MNKEITYSGHTASSSDYTCADGELSLLVDLWSQDNVLKPVQRPKEVFKLPDGYNVLYVHESNEYKHYIAYSPTDKALCWIDDSTKQSVVMETDSMHDNSIVQVAGVGNTLIVLTTKGMCYYLWKVDGSTRNYLYLGTEIPELDLSFGLQGEMKRYPEDGSKIDITFEQINKANIFEEFSKDNKTTVSNQILGEVNKFIADYSTNTGKFIYPFLVRYAYRLYDGTLTHHSAPVLMLCSSGLSPLVIWTNYNSTQTNFTSAQVQIMAMCHRLDYAAVDYDQITQLRNWSDIVKSVDVFVSKPIYSYDQSGQVQGFAPVNLLDSFCICKHTNPFTSLPASQQRYQYMTLWELYKLTFDSGYNATPGYQLLLPHKSDETIKDEIKNTSQFFLLQKIAIEDISRDRVAIEVKDDYLQSLVAREVMDDDFDSHDSLIPAYAFPYNSRLNITDLKKKLFKGYNSQSLLPFTNGYINNITKVDIDNDKSYFTYYVFIKENGREIVVENDMNPIGAGFKGGPRFFYYPNTNAYKVVIAEHSSPSGAVENTYELNLEPHNFLNGSFYFAGWNEPGVASVDVPTASSDDERIVNLSNRIYTSEVNNPFKWPVQCINSVGSGRVLGISAAAKALSQGQFGQFPLYAFTTDGVWALEVSTTTGAYSARQPITRDVCTNPRSITQLDDAVLFVTDRGIMIISGSQTKCISEAIDDLNKGTFRIDSLPKAKSLLGELPKATPIDPNTPIVPIVRPTVDDDDLTDSQIGQLTIKSNVLDTGILEKGLSVDIVPFRQFLSSCGMIYDYPYQRLIVFNPSCNYAYIYSMNDKRWAMMRCHIASAVGSYPEALAMNSDNILVDYSCHLPNDTPANQVLVTRPLKLEEANIMKTIDHIIQRGHFNRGEVKTLLYGSRDLDHWYPVASSVDHYLRGFSGTPYKYFRVALKCSLTDTEELEGCSIEYTHKESNQLR